MYMGGFPLSGWLFIGFGFNGSPHILVRYMALRNTRDVKRIALIGIIWMMIAYYGASFIGMSGAVLFPNLENPEHIFPTMTVELLPWWLAGIILAGRSEEHTSELQSRFDLVCRLLLEKKKNTKVTRKA